MYIFQSVWRSISAASQFPFEQERAIHTDRHAPPSVMTASASPRPPSGRVYRAGSPRVIMSRRPLCLMIALGLLLLASGCSSGTFTARCTVNRDSVDGAGNAKVNDYVANMGR